MYDAGMIILGLGSNLGKREALLREAIRKINHLNGVQVKSVSFLYESEAMLLPDADPSWNKPFLNCALSITTKLTPHELLKGVKEIESELGRAFKVGERWAPRPIDIDFLQWDDLQINTPELTIPHIGLLERPFALLPLADLYEGAGAVTPLGKEQVERWRGAKDVPFSTVRRGYLYPSWVGILNLTPDSFSDGGVWQDSALEHAEDLIAAGADVIDIGAESTRPKAKLITPAEEWKRLEKILPLLNEKIHKKGAIVSIDTYHPETAERAIALGVDWINDVSGLVSEKMLQVIVASADVKYVLMHALSVPPSSDIILADDVDLFSEISTFFEGKIEALERCGVSRERVILDPGLGVGKSVTQNMDLVRHAERLHQSGLGLPLLYGHSRKLFIKDGLKCATRNELDIETAAISCELALKGIDYIRVHDVALNAETLHHFSACNKICRYT